MEDDCQALQKTDKITFWKAFIYPNAICHLKKICHLYGDSLRLIQREYKTSLVRVARKPVLEVLGINYMIQKPEWNIWLIFIFNFNF